MLEVHWHCGQIGLGLFFLGMKKIFDKDFYENFQPHCSDDFVAITGRGNAITIEGGDLSNWHVVFVHFKSVKSV